jgi:hypothetical protein
MVPKKKDGVALSTIEWERCKEIIIIEVKGEGGSATL